MLAPKVSYLPHHPSEALHTALLRVRLRLKQVMWDQPIDHHLLNFHEHAGGGPRRFVDVVAQREKLLRVPLEPHHGDELTNVAKNLLRIVQRCDVHPYDPRAFEELAQIAEHVHARRLRLESIVLAQRVEGSDGTAQSLNLHLIITINKIALNL